jgi:cell division protein FtsA
MIEATNSIVEVMNQAASIIGLPIKSVVFGINSSGINFVNSQGLVLISQGDSEITAQDVARVIEDSISKAFGVNGSEIIHAIPKNYTLDNQSDIKNPIGMLGSKLEARVLIVTLETSYLRNFVKVLQQSELLIEDKIYTGLATSEFLLTDRQKKSGTAIIDFGYNTTTCVVWQDQEVKANIVLPVGSEHITNDLAIGLQTNVEMAEEIKKQYLDLASTSTIEEIEVFNEERQITEKFKIKDIQSYAVPRVEDILTMLIREFRKENVGSLPGGAIIIGGGANLKNLDVFAKDILRMPVYRYTFDSKIIDFIPDYNNEASYINAICLGFFTLLKSEEMNYNFKSVSKNNSNNSKSLVSKALSWLKSMLP